MTVKASRHLTHVRRLRDPDDPDLLRDCLRQFPAPLRVAVEPRHESWWTDEVREVLAAANAALCWADRGGSALGPLWRTADWGYLRSTRNERGGKQAGQERLEASGESKCHGPFGIKRFCLLAKMQARLE